MIGLDAAEYSLIQSWIEEGALPNLARLSRQGASGRLDSTAKWLVGSPWPSFYTSSLPSDHGLYHYLQWRPEMMKHDRPSKDWLPLDPFWRRAARDGCKVIAFDVPLAYAPESFPGIEISGWATHELLQEPASHPPDLLKRIEQEYGRPPFDAEESRLLSHAEFLGVRDQCIKTTQLVRRVATDLMQREAWDLFVICFAATHRAGHQLWDETNIVGTPTPEQKTELDDALRQVYIAIDHAIGDILEKAGKDAVALVFSLHGMGVNVSRAEVMREMLTRVVEDTAPTDGAAAHRKRLVDRLREVVPLSMRARIKTKLPRFFQDWLTLFWRTSDIDWSKTAAFSAFSDLDGYIRVNLKGRESEGIIEPGEEYEAVLRKVEDGLKSYVDVDTGEPVVAETIRATELFGDDTLIKNTVPDLMVRWAPSSAAIHRKITSPRFGEIAWPTPGRHPQARSGNHRPEGFLIAAGGGIKGGTALKNAHIVDLAPTAFALLGLDPPKDYRGKPLFARQQEGTFAES
jgi:predicted AlkP superfamily phosphohydrolase/phosphomutase